MDFLKELQGDFKDDPQACGQKLFTYFILANRTTEEWKIISSWYDSLTKKQQKSLE